MRRTGDPVARRRGHVVARTEGVVGVGLVVGRTLGIPAAEELSALSVRVFAVDVGFDIVPDLAEVGKGDAAGVAQVLEVTVRAGTVQGLDGLLVRNDDGRGGAAASLADLLRDLLPVGTVAVLADVRE